MKFKNAEAEVNDIPDMPESAGLPPVDTFTSGVPVVQSSGNVGTLIAFLASLAAAALLGATAAMMYVNWGLIAEA